MDFHPVFYLVIVAGVAIILMKRVVEDGKSMKGRGHKRSSFISITLVAIPTVIVACIIMAPSITKFWSTHRDSTYNLAVTYCNQGNAKFRKGESDLAIQDYDKAIELWPHLAEAYNGRGSAYLSKDDLDRAVQDLDKAIGLKPDYAEAYCNRGILYHKKGDQGLAIQDLSRAIQLKPDYAKAYLCRGISYELKGNLDRSKQDFDKAKQLDPFKALNLP